MTAALPFRLPPGLAMACRECAHQDHRACAGLAAGCRCAQCHRLAIMRSAAEAIAGSNDTGTIRQAAMMLLSLQAQAAFRNARRAAREPRALRCQGCGKPVIRKRVDSRGAYCSPRCKMRVARRRWAQAGPAAAGIASPADRPERPAAASMGPRAYPIPASELSPAEVWAMIHRG